MSNDYSYVKEFWTVNTTRGPRAYFFSNLAGRALPVPHAVAEMLEATGQAIRTEKPAFVGRPRGSHVGTMTSGQLVMRHGDIIFASRCGGWTPGLTASVIAVVDELNSRDDEQAVAFQRYLDSE